MEINPILDKYHFPPEIKQIYLNDNIKTLFPPQVDAIKKGVLDGRNLLMSVPTASGKTLIAELCMLKSILDSKGTCLYIVPLKALASEKYEEFRKKFSPLGIKIGLALGDTDSLDTDLSSLDILIATSEKIDSLLRKRKSSLFENIGCLVVDEIHFINDGTRGPTLEIIIARLKQLNPNTQILGLSATISNAFEISCWLEAQLTLSSFRPIPLKEGIYFNDRIKFVDSTTKSLKGLANDDINKLVLDTLHGAGQVLVFVNSRRSTQSVSKQLVKNVSKLIKPKERLELLKLSKKIAGKTDSTKVCRKLADMVRMGVAFHHAGLKSNQREIVEKAFKDNLIKVICCTPTLAAGVNLPARRVIIRDIKRFEEALGSAYIPVSEYKQCAGRAGRPKYDKYGESIIIAKTSAQSKTLISKYIHSDSEPIESKLNNESALRTHILSSIAGGYIHDLESMFDFFDNTFMNYQQKSRNLHNKIMQVLEFLINAGFIDKSQNRFFATAFGSLTSRLYIDPMSSITIKEALETIQHPAKTSDIGIIHLITCCPDCVTIKNVNKLFDEMLQFETVNEDNFIITKANSYILNDFYYYLTTLKTTFMLSEWVEEKSEDNICEVFSVGAGDIYRIIESAEWLLYAAQKIAELLRKKILTFKIGEVQTRIKYGIKNELLSLIKLKNVGRIRARNLFSHGVTKPIDLKTLSLEKVAKIPSIGKKVASDLLNQLDQPQTT